MKGFVGIDPTFSSVNLKIPEFTTDKERFIFAIPNIDPKNRLIPPPFNPTNSKLFWNINPKNQTSIIIM